MTSGLPRVAVSRAWDPGQLAAVLPNVAMRATPLQAAPFHATSVTFRLGDLTLQYGDCSPLLLLAAVGRGTSVLQLPFENADTLLVNGQLMPPRGFRAYGEGADMVRASPQRTTYAALILPPDTAATRLGEAPGAPLLRAGRDELMQAPPESWRRIRGLVTVAARIALEAPDIFATEAPCQALRHALLGAAGELLARARPREPARRVPMHQAWRRIVFGADAYLEAHLGRAIYTEELCAALGVPAAGLREAFRATLGTSLHRYLKLRRLTLVRAALRQAEGPLPLVKAVALAHGFWHLGQFAHDYREAFGESPSATVAARGSRAVAPAGLLAGARRAG